MVAPLLYKRVGCLSQQNIITHRPPFHSFFFKFLYIQRANYTILFAQVSEMHTKKQMILGSI